MAVEIVLASKIYERNGKLSVIAEFHTEQAVQEVMRNKKNLVGSNIFIEFDLNSERQKNVMLELKKDILHRSKAKRVNAFEDKLVIETKTFVWNRQNKLECEKRNAEDVLKELYGTEMNGLNVSYETLLKKINSKN